MKIAVIPARGGSKRIPGKNVRDFCGKPMIAWPIEAATASSLFDHVVVSTDNAAIAAIAARTGAEVPFSRPPALSGDDVSTDDVIAHAIRECIRVYGSIEQACCIYPATPFLRAADLVLGLDMLLLHRATAIFPVVRYDFPIEQAFLLDGVRPRARWPDKLAARSQDLPHHYHDAGMFYWFDVERFLREPRLLGDNFAAFVIPADRCQDINTLEDWARAELKYHIMSAAPDQ